MLGLNMLISPVLSSAAPVIPGFAGKVAIPVPTSTTALPILRPNTTPIGLAPVNGIVYNGNTLTINQNASQAIINWESFNIGAAAAVKFNQKNPQGVAQKDWAALNRIYDKDPSLIFGKLTADGKVYLINQNGIMFGAGSQVNVSSLAASTLNLKDSDFMNRALRFTAENYQELASPSQTSVIANQGAITTTSGGSVFLLGSNVENSGSIVAPAGKINLIASSQTNQDPTGKVADVQITELAESGSNDVVYRTVPTYGQARNLEGGTIQADQGRVGMFGNQVMQNGLIRAITAVKKNGQIYLAASDRVTTGARSVTDVSITDSDEKVDQSFSFSGGSVTVGGLNTTTDAIKSYPQTLQSIEHNGAILAPSGSVEMKATKRVFLGETSKIDVAGLWVDRAASDNQIEVQLNSVELKDSYGQKNGFLKGEKIKVDVLAGTAIGDISGSYLIESKTARQRATKGGTISIGAPGLYMPGTSNDYVLDDIVVKPGALLDFSGGGFRYAPGTLVTSKLLSGNTLYDISSAPQWLTYSKLSTGSKYVSGRTVGSDAGKTNLEARQVLLDGTLKATVTRGQYQTVNTTYTTTDQRNYNISVARGLEEPTGGTLLIGKKVESGAGTAFADFRTREIVVAADTNNVSSGFGTDPEKDDPNREKTRTILSAKTLSRLNLGSLGLYANTSLTINPGSRLSLIPGAVLDARARVISQQGEISVPAGKVSLFLQDNISSHPQLQGKDQAGAAFLFTNDQYKNLTESFTMENGAGISVAGERIDNSPKGIATNGLRNGHTTGGTILIKDNTAGGTKGVVTPVDGFDSGGHSLIIRSGADLDVSGGYTIDTKGKLSGADAGTLELRSATMSLAGDLRGHSLMGKKGGQLILHAGEVQVSNTSLYIPDQVGPEVPLPETLKGKLVLGEDRLANSGFGRIELTAVKNLSIAEGVTLTPSITKLATPTLGKSVSANSSLFAPAPKQGDISPDYTGATSIKLNAGVNIYTDSDFSNGVTTPPFDANLSSAITQESGSRIVTAPGGSISLSAPAILVKGTLEALSGSISLKASQTNLSIANGASISAVGYNKPNLSTIVGVPTGSAPQPGGTVSLESTKEQVILEQGSLVDVSGTEPTTTMVKNAAGLPVATVVASTPGSLSLTSSTGLLLDGRILGKASIQGQPGGTLSVNQTAGTDMTVSAEDVRRYMTSGFDALTFASATSLLFQSGMDMQIGRSLILDAPVIKGNGRDNVTLSSPWIRLINSSKNLPTPQTVEQGTSLISLNGEWLDMEGSTALSGFGTARLLANKDMRLSDKYYGELNNGTIGWYGGLQTGGELVLKGARIYPTTASDFSIISGKSVTILPGTLDRSPIYSAGGNLTITATTGINHSGFLAAPMGQITLKSNTGRVYLADGSVTKTSGDAQVNYGAFDGTFWTVKDPGGSNNKKGARVEGAPLNSITLNAKEVIVRAGAALDNSGGGSISTYLFQPGIEGSYDPISIDGRSSANTTVRSGPNRFVILRDNSVQLPGFTYTDAAGKTRLAGAVHLEATRLDDGTWLKEGTYSLLPEEYAFIPGARIISDLGTAVASGTKLRTTEGYQVLAGYDTYAGTSATTQLKGFSIRLAAEVLKEGNFTIPKPKVAGNSGDLTIKGTSTILNGTLSRNALNGYIQGLLSLSGKEISIQEGTVALPTDFDFTAQLTGELAGLSGKMQVAASALSSGGGGPLTIGDSSVTDSITVKAGSTLNAPKVTLHAKNSITLEQGANAGQGARIEAGTATLSTPDGTVVIQSNAEVHATETLNLIAASLDQKGELKSDRDISLTSKNIVIAPDADTSPGLHLTDKLVESFKTLDNVTLASTGDSSTGGTLTFLKSADLAAKKSLTIDAARLVNGGTANSEFNVTMTAPGISLKNSGKTAPDPALAPMTGSTLMVNADATMLSDNIVVDRFEQVSFKTVNDLTLAGAGSLKTKGDLAMDAARVTTTYSRDADNVYHAADFSIKADGDITITKSATGKTGDSTTPGGILSFTGSSITDSGAIVMPAGQVNLTATVGDITLDGATIQAGGFKQLAADNKTYDYAPGGQITLLSDNGAVKLNKDTATLTIESVLDVSADPSGGDAGTIALIAPKNGVDLTGASLKGSAAKGQGGSFFIDTDSLDTVSGVNKLSGLIDKLKYDLITKTGGFNDRLNIHARKGDLDLAAGRTITGNEVVIAADGADNPATKGNITLNGKIDVSNGAGDGGRVELYANRSLTMQAASSINASGTGKGGEVWLGNGNNKDSVNSKLTLASGSLVNVSGGTTANGGSVYLRALRKGTTGVNMDLKGTVTGAKQVVAEAVRVYDNTTGVITDSATKTNDQYNDDSYLKFKQDTDEYMSTATLARPTGVDTATKFHFRPGVEVRSSGDLALAADWDLTNWRYGANSDEPGVLTLRSKGNLTFGTTTVTGTNGYNLTDAPTPLANLNSKIGGTLQNSWGINLAAGADLTGANPLSTVHDGTGNLLLGPSSSGALKVDASGNANGGALVYTENAPLRFSSGNDTDIGTGVAGKFMLNDTLRYNIGTYGGAIRGETGNDLTVRAGAIQSAVGDIDLRVRGDLFLDKQLLGSIRTTGEYTPGASAETSPGGDTRVSQITDYWTYSGGGDITLAVAGAVSGKVNRIPSSAANSGLNNAWDAPVGGSTMSDKFLAASYVGSYATAGIATMAGGNVEVRSGGDFTSQTGVFGAGNLSIVSGGDLNGRFRLMNGDGLLRSMGNFGTSDTDGRQVLELADARLTVSAQGDMHIGTVLNPDNTREKVSLNSGWNLTYGYADPDVAGSRNAEAAFRSLAGSVTIDGESGFDGYSITGTGTEVRRRILTPTFSVLADGDIKINNSLALAPSSTGNLQLAAGGTIDGGISGTNSAKLAMMDYRPEDVYGRFTTTEGNTLQEKLFAGGQSGYLLHAGDSVPVEITAARGDITNLQLDLSKQAVISAVKGDIRELKFKGQNVGATGAAGNITTIRAGHDIYYSYVLPQPSLESGLLLGGPGTFLIQAGNNIELGNSAGIQSLGNRLNSALGSTGSTTIVIAGAKTDIDMTASAAADFFYGADHTANNGNGNGLRWAGIEYSALYAKGDKAAADQRIKDARRDIIRNYFVEPVKDENGEFKNEGSINMISSQISTLTGKDEIFLLSRANLNVGKSTFVDEATQKTTGISTIGGGPINIYSGGDVNVNESRVMSLLGGTITVWSDQGNINAGRGSKTTVAAPQTIPVYDKKDPTKLIGFRIEPPSIGSGIRAVTFDPNATPAGDLPIPEPGDINLFAPEGAIDAGEAGIAGGKITLGATAVLNVKNISASAGSVGVPSSSEGSVSLGALAGAGGLTDSSKMMEQSSAMGSAKDKSAVTQSNQVDEFMSKFLDVRVISFDTEESTSEKEKGKEKKK